MPLDTRQLKCMPLGLDPQSYNEDKAATSTQPGIPLPELGKVYTAELQARCFQPPFPSLLYSHDKESNEKQFARSNMRSWCAATPNGPLESSQKRLLIFDQSGNQTRLLRCPFPLQFPSPATAEPRKLPSLHDLEKGFGEEDRLMPPLQEMFDENEKESEMHEDTEEINALLYSDDDYDDDDNDNYESDDEVMSTGHSPFPVSTKRELEEINIYDGPCKRQKLPVSNISTKQDTSSGLSNGQSRKDKVHTVLKILESVVPGSKGKDSLLLLDEAIDYLKLLKRNLISPEINHHY